MRCICLLIILIAALSGGCEGGEGGRATSAMTHGEPELTVTAGCDSITISARIADGDTTSYYITVAELRADGASIRRVRLPDSRRVVMRILNPATVMVTAQAHAPGDYIGVGQNAAPRSCDGHPVAGALPAMMWGAATLEAAMTVFRDDSVLYPNRYDRYLPLWWGKLQSGFDADSILQDINLLAISFPSDSSSDRMIRLGRAAALWSARRSDEAIAELQQIEMGPAGRHSLTHSETVLLEHIVSFLLEGKPGGVAIGTVEQRMKGIDAIGGIVLRDDNISMVRYILGEIFMHTSRKFPTQFVPLVRSLLAKASMHLDRDDPRVLHAELGDLLPFVVGMWQMVGEPGKSVEVFERHIASWRAVPEWTGENVDAQVAVLPRNSTELSIAMDAGEAYRAAGDSTKAIMTARTAFETLSDAAEAPRSFAAATLASWYIDAGDVTLARRFADSAARLRSPFAQALHRRIDSVGGSVRTGMIATSAAPQSVVRIQSVTQLPAAVQTAIGSGRLYCVMFTSESCGPCVRYSPAIVEAISAEIPGRAGLIIATQESPTYTQWERKGYTTVHADTRMRSIFGVELFPAVAIARGDTILRMWEEFNDHTASDIATELKRIRK